MMEEQIRLLEIAANIVVAHLQTTSTTPEKIPGLISSVMHSLKNAIEQKGSSILLDYGKTLNVPAVPIEDSVHDDYIVCLEDGKKLKMLKRHLRTACNMTVEEYFKKWGLPKTYPTVAPNYQERRRVLARCNRFGFSIKAQSTPIKANGRFNSQGK